MNFVENVIGRDEFSETVELFIDGARVGSLDVDGERKDATLRIELEPGFHEYELRGVASMKDGRSLAITGGGSIASHQQLWPAFRDATSLADAYRAAFRDAPRFHFTALDVSEEDLEDAEARLGVALPRVYREEMLRGGAFSARWGENPVALLYHPRELLSSWDWLVRFHNYTPLDEEVKLLKRDICFADFEGPMVFFYAPDKRCPDGEPSFDNGFLDFVEMTSTRTDSWEAYLAPGSDHCDWNAFMRDALYDAVTEVMRGEEASVSDSGWSVWRRTNQPGSGEFSMFLGAPSYSLVD